MKAKNPSRILLMRVKIGAIFLETVCQDESKALSKAYTCTLPKNSNFDTLRNNQKCKQKD